VPLLQTEDDLCRWTLIVVFAYICLAYLIRFSNVALHRSALPSSKFGIAKLFDGFTFATCLLLLVGAADPLVFTLLGSTKSILIVAGFAGTIHSMHELFAIA
jgi:hypothetical protein